jgi:hypothetical protein
VSTNVKSQIDLEEEIQAQKKPFHYLTFRGGRAKEAAYSGVHEALEKAGVIDGVEECAGSSAGAITATMFASGIESDKFKKLGSDTNFKQLLGKEGFLIMKDGEPIREFASKVIKDNISAFVEKNDVQALRKVRTNEIEKFLASNNNDHADQLKVQQSKDDLAILNDQVKGTTAINDLSNKEKMKFYSR